MGTVYVLLKTAAFVPDDQIIKCYAFISFSSEAADYFIKLDGVIHSSKRLGQLQACSRFCLQLRSVFALDSNPKVFAYFFL